MQDALEQEYCVPLREQAGMSAKVNQLTRVVLARELRTNPRPSRTASTIPAVNDEQLNWLMSRGTEMYRSMAGSLSIIMSAL